MTESVTVTFWRNIMKTLILFVSLIGCCLAFDFSVLAQEASPLIENVPDKEKVGSLVRNYNPFLPHLATSGAVKPEKLAEIKALGFKSILDMRTSREGVAEVKKMATELGITFGNIPIGMSAPSPEALRQFGDWVENQDNYPTLVYCGSGNRVGLMWGMYQVGKGVSLMDAFREAQAIGMKGTRGQQLIDFARQPRMRP